MSEDDLTQALTAACICCILAKAGPQRSRILANLYKDERTRALPIFPFLQKVYLERILRQDEVRSCNSVVTLNPNPNRTQMAFNLRPSSQAHRII